MWWSGEKAEDPEGETMIELEHVTKRYGGILALQDVSLRVSSGEVVGLLGRNGAGKTTALNLMTGFFPPSEGRVRIGGKEMLSDPRGCKRMIGYLPEKPPLYDEMTVEDYLLFVSELREVVRKALGGLTEMRRRVIGHLSKGYRQWTGIAQALCGAPEILILDEPTVGLDPKQTVEMRELIRELGKTPTVIFSSHILGEVQQLCSRVIILHEGRMIQSLDLKADTGDMIRLRLQTAAAPGLADALRGAGGNAAGAGRRQRRVQPGLPPDGCAGPGNGPAVPPAGGYERSDPDAEGGTGYPGGNLPAGNRMKD